MKNAILTISTAAAAVIAALLALRPPAHQLPDIDPADRLLDLRGCWWSDNRWQSLDEAVAEVEKETGIHILLDWEQFHAAGISTKKRQLFARQNFAQNLRTTLSALAWNFSESPDKKDLMPSLSFSLTPAGDLFVSIDHNVRRCTRIYDVRDLVSDGYWGPISGGAGDPMATSSRTAALADLIDERLARVDFLAWLPGLPMDGIYPSSGKLFITTTPAKHRQICRILSLFLRRMK